MDPGRGEYDVVVVGGGHNGLAAAAYLARAGLSVLVLERLDHIGGAAVSAVAFPGFETRVSRYSTLVSLLPSQVVEDLELDVALRSRPTASYTPVVRDGKPGGLLVERDEGEATRQSFQDLTGSDAEYDAWRAFYADVAGLADVVAPTMLSPLPLERDVRERVDKGVWRDLVEQPLGATLAERLTDDTVRGVVATDALIGTFASMHDPSLVQNRCFLYHRIGNGTGEWRVPVGGMGAVATALAKAAAESGAEVLTGAGVSGIRARDDGAEVTWHDGSAEHTVAARFVLSDVAPWVLRILMGEPDDPETKPEGAQLTINFLLDRLPRLESGMDPEVAFAGTLHLGEDYSQLEAAYADAAAGRVPASMPGQVHCHSLTDPSILGDVPDGTHTLTYFGLHTPASLFDRDPDAKELAVRRAHRLAGRAPGRAAHRLRRARRRRPTVHRGQDPAGHRDRSGDARRPHLPRRPRLALGLEPLAARHPRPAVGRPDRRRLGAPVRLRRASRRCGLRHRRPQRRPGRPRDAVGGPPIFLGPRLAGRVHGASPPRASSSIGRAADS